MRMCWVEFDNDRIIRIFRNRKAAADSISPIAPANVTYAFAVKCIRFELWLRCGGFCELCGELVTQSSGQMHEQKWRGKGGEISLENSVFICAKTHKLEHKDRSPQFTRRKS